jgi:hypothetical protein
MVIVALFLLLILTPELLILYLVYLFLRELFKD